MKSNNWSGDNTSPMGGKNTGCYEKYYSSEIFTKCSLMEELVPQTFCLTHNNTEMQKVLEIFY